MTAAPLPENNETVRDFATKALQAEDVANSGTWPGTALSVPPAWQAFNQSPSDDKIPDEGMSATLRDGSYGPGFCHRISVTDWNLLFSAIEARLRLAVGERASGAPAPEAGDLAGQVQVAVLDCVSAMEVLHAALTLERGGVAKPRQIVAWP